MRTLTQNAELIASNGHADDWFGFSVSVAGNTVAVGAPQRNVGSNQGQGMAYVFVKPRSGWRGQSTENAKLEASDGHRHDVLGYAVAVTGRHIVVGAPQRQRSLPNQGTLYLFDRPASGWAGTITQKHELTVPAKNENLGGDVSWSGNTLASGSSIFGFVYVFVYQVPLTVTIKSPSARRYAVGTKVKASY
jgi:hypothetical protein